MVGQEGDTCADIFVTKREEGGVSFQRLLCRDRAHRLVREWIWLVGLRKCFVTLCVIDSRFFFSFSSLAPLKMDAICALLVPLVGGLVRLVSSETGWVLCWGAQYRSVCHLSRLFDNERFRCYTIEMRSESLDC